MSYRFMEDAQVIGLFWATVGRATDRELVAQFQGGDTSAYSEIVHRYQDRVFTLALRWMRDQAVAEEVAQDVFIALFRSLGTFRGDSKLSTWVYRVVVNHCKNRIQYRRRRHMDRHEPLEGVGGDGGHPPRQLASDAPGADASRHRTEAEQRMIIVLRDIEDLSYVEIGAIMDVPRGTVKSRLHRARTQLATVLSRRIGAEDVL
jgi:RNA polymerase sigma-70 factor (ECF subfamily)